MIVVFFLLVLVPACTCRGRREPSRSRPTPAPGTRLQRYQGPDKPVKDPPPVSGPQVKRAREAVEELKAAFQKLLREALEEGPESAILVMKRKAKSLPAEGRGLRRGHTSHRTRNPENAPRAWVKPLLEAYLRNPRQPFRTVKLEGGTIGYVEPIYTRRLCLQCHGSNISPAVAERLKQHYPKDNTTGFEPGDLRGLYWAEVDP